MSKIKINGITVGTPQAVDQSYNAKSPRPQSGKAVAEAIANLGGGGGGGGTPGKDGEDGVGIASVEQTYTSNVDGGSNVITVTLTDGTKYTFTVKNGKKGGDGEDGVTFIPSVDAEGFLNWTNDKGVDNPPSVYIKGNDGYTPIKDIDYRDGYDGKDGVDGHDGTSVLIDYVEESTEDGGSNIVVFDNGTRLTIKNGRKGSKGDKGDPYTLTEADKTAIAEGVTASLEGIPSYWQHALDEGVEAINAAVETAGRNKSAFLFYTDAHWGYGSGMSPNLLKYLGKNTAINKTIFGGDFGNTYEYPSTGKTMDDWMEVMRSWKLAVRDIPNHHSVVGNHDQEVQAISNDKALYGFLFAPEETPDIVRGGDFFYYIDEPSERTRYLYLNTGLCNFSDEQCKFAIEALKTTPAEWHIVAVSHIWFVYDDTSTPTVGSVPTNIQKVLLLFDAYNERATGSMTIDSETHAYDFTDCGAWVEFCIGGHTHVDHTFTSTNGIPVILCQTDSKHLRGNQYTYTAGTTTEAAVSAIVADYDNKKINVVRVGRGESFDVEITNYVVSYTNVLPKALASDGVSVYNGKGWKENTRWSSSGNSEGTQAGTYITGWIPFKAGDIFYLKNIILPNADGNTCMLHLFKTIDDTSEGNINNSNLNGYYNPVWDDSGNLVQFSIPSSSVYKYARIQCGGIDDTSIITINEPIE